MKFPELNEVFEGRYEIQEVLGEGAFARVYKAWDVSNGRFVALKVLSPKGGAYSDLSGARFLREARIVAGLQSPHSITMYDVGQTASGLMYMACEYLQGRDLHLELMTSRRLPAPIVAHVLDQLLQSLLEAHGLGVFHRDIKPANILLTEYQGDNYRATLVDFGLARPIQDDSTQLTKPGKTVGTPRYMAPEQIYAEEMGPGTDLYSLGLVAFEMWTGGPAIRGESQKELLLAQINGPPIKVPEHLQPAELRAIIETMTRREISERYESADAVLKDLRSVRRALQGRAPMPQLKHDADEPVPSDKGRRWDLVVLGVAVVLVAVMGIAALVPVETTSTAVPTPIAIPTQLTEVRETVASPRPDTASLAEDTGVVVTPRLVADRRCAELRDGTRLYESSQGRLFTYVPEGLTPENARAVVVLLRRGGDTLTTTEFISYTGFDRVADEHKLLLLAPNHKNDTLPATLSRTWDDGSTALAWRRVTAALDELCMEQLPIGLLGEFKGGQAADLIQCSSARVRAIVVSSHRYELSDQIGELRQRPRPCEPETAVPYLEISHTQNGGRPIKGGPSCADASHDWWSLDNQQTRWKKRHECSDEVPQPEKHPNGECIEWSCATPYKTCLVQGGPNWGPVPKVDETAECSGAAVDFPHTEVAWNFFDRFLTAKSQEPETF